MPPVDVATSRHCPVPWCTVSVAPFRVHGPDTVNDTGEPDDAAVTNVVDVPLRREY